jgi:hypothetical protein
VDIAWDTSGVDYSSRDTMGDQWIEHGIHRGLTSRETRRATSG